MTRVLIVDDNPLGRLLVAGVLEGSGRPDLQIVQAASGEEALAELAKQAPDILFTDLHMQDMNGLQLIEQARKAGFHKPIVAVTMEESPDLLGKLVAAGATLVLKKGGSPLKLREALELVPAGR